VTSAELHDGSTIDVQVAGRGPDLFVPVRTAPFEADQAETMRQWGADPDLGPELVRRLSGSFRLITADYEGHRMAHPAARTLTADTVALDLLAIADAAGAGRFSYYGYSWLALCGLQLALRTDRLQSLVMGGFPPLDGPYAEMLAVTRAAHSQAGEQTGAAEPETVTPGDWDSASIQVDPDQTEQFVTLYESLVGFDDRAAQERLTVPRFCFAGASDDIDYSPRWGGVRVRIAEPLQEHRATLEALGWRVALLPGLDHVGAMHAAVVAPLLEEWLARPSASSTG
jgi:pimeloyl-ACP methyl ester carboxylesterase